MDVIRFYLCPLLQSPPLPFLPLQCSTYARHLVHYRPTPSFSCDVDSGPPLDLLPPVSQSVLWLLVLCVISSLYLVLILSKVWVLTEVLYNPESWCAARNHL